MMNWKNPLTDPPKLNEPHGPNPATDPTCRQCGFVECACKLTLSRAPKFLVPLTLGEHKIKAGVTMTAVCVPQVHYRVRGLVVRSQLSLQLCNATIGNLSLLPNAGELDTQIYHGEPIGLSVEVARPGTDLSITLRNPHGIDQDWCAAFVGDVPGGMLG